MKFLKNFFGSKKEKVEEKTKVVLSMPLFKGEETYDLNTLIEDLKNYWALMSVKWMKMKTHQHFK